MEVISYLNTAPGKFVSLPEIARRAGGRRRFEETPGWAKTVLPTLVDAKLVEVNSRGHYRVSSTGKSQAPSKPAQPHTVHAHHGPKGKILGGDYFPAAEQPRIVAGDYFPSTD